MPFFTWLRIRRTSSRPIEASGQPRRTCRLRVEHLEDRLTPTNFSAATVPELIAAIDAANLTPEADTIALAPATTLTLTAVNNNTHGATGLPTIAANEDLTILGNGDTIERAGTSTFRLFDVAAGASLRLENLTLRGGYAYGRGVAAEGGAIYSGGDLSLRDVIVQNNIAQGASYWLHSPGGSAAGGGIYSAGSLVVEGGAIWNNQAIGGKGSNGALARPPVSGVGLIYIEPGPGGSGYGGGLYVAGGTATLTDVTLAGNTARGGDGGAGVGTRRGSWGGAGHGGGVYVGGGTVSLSNATVSSNTAQGGAGGRPTPGFSLGGKGGGIYINSAALVYVDAFTVAHVIGNHAFSLGDNIYGPYTLV